MATGETATIPDADAETDLDIDLEELKKAKPILVYFYVTPVADPMDDNYKFSRKFELGCLQSKVVKLINRYYAAKMVALPAEADMTQVKNTARLEIWSVTGKKMGAITQDNIGLLNKSPLMAYLKQRVAKNKSLVKKEVARITKLRKQAEQKRKAEERRRRRAEEETASK